MLSGVGPADLFDKGAQIAGLATASAINLYELFTDIVDGIEDVVNEEDIAGQSEDLEFDVVPGRDAPPELLSVVFQAGQIDRHFELLLREG